MQQFVREASCGFRGLKLYFLFEAHIFFKNISHHGIEM